MLKMVRVFLWSFLIFKIPSAFAIDCAPEALIDDPHHVLACYIAKSDAITSPNWEFKSAQHDATNKLTIETYSLTSQIWQGKKWQHTLVIYRPDILFSNQALLVVNGGTHYPQANNNPLPAQFNFAYIAKETQTVVIDLQDVPNQYLTFEDAIPRKEDGLVAYSWNQFMDDPLHHQDWPLQLPMTKSVIKAMDATQAILQEKNIHIEHFVVTGASKRGWATWLAAIVDKRINAIVPIVIDILNLQENIQHIYAFYNQNWPTPAFYDYVQANIPKRLSSTEFGMLANISDPFSYLNTQEGKERLAIPKYIISAARDDFFVPDALNLYVNQLPGETNIRVFPQEGHYIDMNNAVEPALLSFYRMIVNKEPRPMLSWHVNAEGMLDEVRTNMKPEKIQLHEIINPEARDFRKFSVRNIIDQALDIPNDCGAAVCNYPIVIKPPEKGWQTAFVEVTFKKENGEYLILTTPGFVLGTLLQ